MPTSGNAMLAYEGKAYVVAADGKNWTVIAGGTGQTGPIPLPAGVTEMRDVRAEIAPSRRPFVFFRSGASRYGAFFDGAAFVGLTELGQATAAHADAIERIIALGPNGLVLHAKGASPVVRGALPYPAVAWTVAADGTVHLLRQVSLPSGRKELRDTRLGPNALAWTGDDLVGWNQDWGYQYLGFTAAPDGSLHAAYALSSSAYTFRSKDGGVTWEAEYPWDALAKASLIDPMSAYYPSGSDASRVGGNILAIAAQSYDDVQLLTSANVVLRRCAPFEGYNSKTWPSERAPLLGYTTVLGTIDERGLPSIMTPSGCRQKVSP